MLVMIIILLERLISRRCCETKKSEHKSTLHNSIYKNMYQPCWLKIPILRNYYVSIVEERKVEIND